MTAYQIKPNWEYWYFENQEEFYATLEDKLNQGYEIIDSFHLCVEIKKRIIKLYFLLLLKNVLMKK